MLDTRKKQAEIKIKEAHKEFSKGQSYLVSWEKARTLVEEGIAEIVSQIKNK